jgi:type IV pilus assembly protein PilC
MRHPLSGGLTLRETLDLLASRGPLFVRPAADALAKDLKAGWSLADALAHQSGRFPPLFVGVMVVGEESGKLPELLAMLERHYAVRTSLRSTFVSAITIPVLQFVFATLVIAALIVILGLVAQMRPPGSEPAAMDPLGLGLIGVQGGLMFLVWVYGGLLVAALLGLVAWRLLSRRRVFWKIVHRLPVIGRALLSLTLSSFCAALAAMLDSSSSIFRTIQLALQATDDPAFAAAAPEAEAALRHGKSIAATLQETLLFPTDFLALVTVGEESGTLPEVLQEQAEEYHDRARRKLTLFTQLLAWLVWMVVAAFVIFVIFRIYSNVYISNLKGQIDALPTRAPALPRK